jgi:hypothetical protein
MRRPVHSWHYDGAHCHARLWTYLRRLERELYHNLGDYVLDSGTHRGRQRNRYFQLIGRLEYY